MGVDEGLVGGAFGGQISQQPVEQPHVAAGFQRQVQVGQLAGGGAARIEHHDAQFRARFLGLDDALKQRRMAPGRVRADQHDRIGQLEVFITTRHNVFAEGALVAGHGGRHAQARIGVDVGAADVALHELVRDVVILGQDLARDVQRHRVRPVLGDDAREAGGHRIECLVPAGAL